MYGKGTTPYSAKGEEVEWDEGEDRGEELGVGALDVVEDTVLITR